MVNIAAFAYEKTEPLTEKISRLLTAGAICMLAAACSQIPWNSDSDSTRNEETSPNSAVSAPVEPPASTAAAAPAPVAARVAAPAQTPAAVPPAAAPISAVVPVPPLAKPQETKDLEPPHAIDLARPADDLWDRIRNGFAMADL